MSKSEAFVSSIYFIFPLLLNSAAGARSPASHGWGLVATDSLKAQKISLPISIPKKARVAPLVAIIDTGVDTTHPSLQGKLWINAGETGTDSSGHDRASNGIDDDGNGFIDDVNGWDFIKNSPLLDDQHGHGTHIAGIVSSVAPTARLMILKYYNPKNPAGNLKTTIKAIRYAIKMKADIINFSGGGFGKSQEEETSLREAERVGILVAAAAGNEGLNSDLQGYYPADYGLPNIISVASLDASLNLLPSSNFGHKTVDLAAPGGEILSSLPGGIKGEMTGTSQATAFVSGAAALILQDESLRGHPERIKRQLMASGAPDQRLRDKIKSGARLNSYRALAMKDQSTTALGVPLSATADGSLTEGLLP